MTRYRLAIFDFDGTLADSLPWFRASFQDMIARFDLAPVSRRGTGRNARAVSARNHGAAQSLHVATSSHRQRHAEAQARSRKRDTAVRRHPGDAVRPAALGIKTAIVSSDSEASVRQVLGPTASLITRFDCGAAVFGKHWKFRRVARKLGAKPSETICIGDEIRDIEAADAAGMDSARSPGATRFPPRCRRRGPRISSIRSRRSRRGLLWRDSAPAPPSGLLRPNSCHACKDQRAR